MKNQLLISALMASTVITQVGCEKTDRSFSLLDQGASFQQTGSYTSRKMDILWVVDNSGSMDSSQTNLTNSFNSFISRFQTLGYDFHMAVTSTDAWRAANVSNTTSKNMLQSLRVGEINYSTNPYSWRVNSGVRIMDNTTANLSNVFLKNAMQGVNGTGDERAFSSFQQVLNYSGNSDFRRADAVLAVIIVSDEDDFSGNTSAYFVGDYADEQNSDPVVPVNTGSPWDIYHLYQDSRLYPVSNYKTYLDGLVGAGNYNVSFIGVLDTQCKASLNTSFVGRRIGRRYAELADMTGGQKASLCDNFGSSLSNIAESILSLSSTFKLGREPDTATIRVVVDGVTVNQDANNGWTYNATDFSITLHGNAVPAIGANIQIFFTPKIASN